MRGANDRKTFARKGRGHRQTDIPQTDDCVFRRDDIKKISALRTV